MKILVLADTHIPDRAKKLPQVILEEAKKVDLIIHAGDLIDISVLNELKKINKVKAVAGNMDSSEVLKILPHKEIIAAGKFKIGLTHGEGAMNQLVEMAKNTFKEKLDCIIFGHSHHPFSDFVEGTLMFNPGSVSDKIFAPFNSYGILEVNDNIKAEIKRI